MVVATDARVDAYIADAPEFAQPILVKLRELVHTACPDVTETIKWARAGVRVQGHPRDHGLDEATCGLQSLERRADPRSQGALQREVQHGDGHVRQNHVS